MIEEFYQRNGSFDRQLLQVMSENIEGTAKAKSMSKTHRWIRV
jgi:hypothetical protein